jgi:isopentenyl phosphate kinase
MTTVLKLGGSVLTHKDEPETVDETALAQCVDAIAAAAGEDPLVLVHGGGSFGHYHAERHGVSTTTGTRDATAVVTIHDAMGRLNATVVDALAERDIPGVPVAPLSLARRDAAGELHLPAEPVATLLADGFVPVLYGDVIAHASEGATVLSGDDIVVALARALAADRVGVCSTVPGVLDADGAVVPRIERFADVAAILGESDATDVTGGMAGKVRALLGLDVPASVFGPDDIAAFLAGERPGTTVDGT